jgi:hypothetical protein
MVNGAHPWLLAGPWYRWSDPYDPAVGRLSRPVFQKYETSDFATEFIKDPQRSLKFIDPEDLVRRPVKNTSAKWGFDKTAIRKIYLDTHKRFYLVVCELHCDVPGFPNTKREEVCDTGFVVRRRVPRVPKLAEGKTRKAIEDLAINRARLAEIDDLPHGMKSGATLGLRARAEASYVTARTEFLQTAAEYGISVELQGWIPSPDLKGVGAWQKVEETPASITEHIFQLFPLIPDPRIRNFSGGKRTIYYGVLPVSSSDVDKFGNSRFDDRNLYEIRCFVRRHDPRCPKRRERNHCKGPFVWSRRTESYQLASQFDLTGTSNRPINIFLPDLPALEAAAADLQPGQGAPVRMIAPAGSNLEASGEVPDLTPKTPSAAICSFSIPLITIVASFVFRIFLPIVTILFGLWFLLKLKFCIPPSLSLDAGIAADLDVALGGIEADLEVGIEIGVSVEARVDAGLFADLGNVKDPTTDMPYKDMSNTKQDVFLTAATQSVDFSESAPEGVPTEPGDENAAKRPLPGSASTLEYEERVEVKV